MGALCSLPAAHKDHEDAEEDEAHRWTFATTSSTLRRLRNMSTRSNSAANRSYMMSRDFESEAEYCKALEQLQLDERSRAFDAELAETVSGIERKANDLLWKIREWDRENVYGPPTDEAGKSTGKKRPGEHFLGSVDLINRTKLMEVARRMPKGAHLHIHFNSCLPAEFLIRRARNVEAMYIRSTLPLTTRENWEASRISFMVMTPEEAKHTQRARSKEYVSLEEGTDLFSEAYISLKWMSYGTFQRRFPVKGSNGRSSRSYSEAKTVAAENWLGQKMRISEGEAHDCQQTGRGIWERFNYRTQMMKGLFAYEGAFRSYTKACIKDFVDDNIQYAEIRPNFMSTNSLKSDDGTRSIGNEGIMKIIQEELTWAIEDLEQDGKYFGGMKVIYCTPRSFDKTKVRDALTECLELKKKYNSLLCGFDLVGHEEMGNELRQFVPEFLQFRKNCKAENVDIPFLFHCGETLEVGDKVDGNLFDAILLKSKRIGHGYAVARHPLVMDLLKEKRIAIECCPISNEVLGLTPTIAGHNLPILLANNVPTTINSDNGTFYKSTLSHDFYQVMIGSQSMSLMGWKQLAKWSLEHSCMDPKELEAVTAVWDTKWNEFCKWILDTFSKEMDKFEPIYPIGRH